MSTVKDRGIQTPLHDETIIELFFARDETAITECDRKYGSYLLAVADNILHSMQDSEECRNDTYLNAWNSIPPARPFSLGAYLTKIIRGIAVNRYNRDRRERRIPPEAVDSLSDFEGFLAETDCAREDIEYVNDAVHYVPIGKARLLSIEEAEALLNEGYVYGLPSLACRICREKLIDVDFTDYDAIGLQYLENRVGHRHWRVPFYAFYKYTHTNEKGQKVYATIYVPAVELTGLEEYFAECTESHYHTVSDEAN